MYNKGRTDRAYLTEKKESDQTSDITITVLDAVYWIDSAWKSVTETIIKNTFSAAGFKEKQAENLLIGMSSDMISCSSSTLGDLSTIDDSINEAIRVLDNLLKHIIIGGTTMIASEYIDMDSHVSTFNEWNDDSEKLLVYDNDSGANESEDDAEEKDSGKSPPKLSEALQMVQRLRLYSITQCPQLHQVINDIESKLTDIYLDSKVSFQSTFHSYFTKD